MNNFSQTQCVTKKVVSSRHGVVSSQHKLASLAGAKVLEQGGNAVDAAIATSFALGVVEPWMSGMGGGGFMIVNMSGGTEPSKVVEFGMRSPAGLKVEDYPLSGHGICDDLFPWPNVVDSKNVTGGSAVAVPGQVDGMRVAYQQFASKEWRDLLQPSIELARKGLLVDWYAQLMITPVAEQLAKFPKSKATFLTDSGHPKSSAWTAFNQQRCSLDSLADSLELIATQGPRAFYEGRMAEHMVQEVQQAGGCLSLDDLKTYRADIVDCLSTNYKEASLCLTPRYSAGPSMKMMLEKLENHRFGGNSPGAEDYYAYAKSLRETYQYRLDNDGDTTEPDDACTTHFSVVDADGNMVAVTQTLLSVFGSRLMLPSSGVLMNNGIMWFDPEQGKPNSLGPNKNCLSNMCPVIGRVGDTSFALGSSGGRKIFPAVAQITSLLVDYGMSIEQAFHTPRIDVSGVDRVVIDDKLPVAIRDRLAEEFITVSAPRTCYPYNFACPSAVARVVNTNYGMTEIMSAWSDSVAQSA